MDDDDIYKTGFGIKQPTMVDVIKPNQTKPLILIPPALDQIVPLLFYYENGLGIK